MASHDTGFEQLTVSTVSIGLASIPASATRVALRVDTNGIRWRDDGTAPTAAIGMRMETTDAVFVYDGELSKLRFIRQTADGVLNASYYS